MKIPYRLIAVGLIGMAAGAIPTALYHTHQRKVLESAGNDLIRATIVSGVRERVGVLTGLRRGKIDYLVETKEEELSAEIYHLCLAFPGEIFSNTNNLRALRLAARYRIEHPFKTGDIEMDRTVEEILAKVKDETNAAGPAEEQDRSQPRNE